MLKIPPQQFNFQVRWSTDVLANKQHEFLEEAFNDLHQLYEDITESSIEGLPEEEAHQENLFSIVTWEMRKFNLHWLRDYFDSIDLVKISYAVARILYPDQNWERIENSDIHAVVTNPERTLVFDMKYYDHLSAEGSLALANDPKMQGNQKAQAEAETIRKEFRDRDLRALEITRKLLGMDDADIVPIR